MVTKLSYTANSITLGTGTSKVVLGADSGNLIVKDSDANTSIFEPGLGLQGASAVATYANPAALPFNPISSAGSLAYTTSTGALYMSNGSGWYKVTLVNTAPSISLSSTTASPTASNLTLDFTYTVTEPEGTPTTISIANSGIATVGNVAITHTTSNNHVRLVFDGTTKYSGDALVTLSVTDGVNTGTGTITITTAYYAGTNTAETVTLLKATGTGNNDNWDDKSSSNHTILDYGAIEQLAFSPYRDNGYSMYFDGSDDYLSYPSHADFTPGTGDFTLEAWVYPTSIPGGGVNNDMCVFGHFGSPSMFFFLDNATLAPKLWNGTSTMASDTGLNINQWHHIAFSRTSGTLKIFTNGEVGYSASYTFDHSATTTSLTGKSSAGSNRYFYGYIADLRFVKGTGVYTTEFAPPTSRLTTVTNTKLLVGGNGFRDASTSNHTITRSGDAFMAAYSPYDRGEAYTTATGGGSARLRPQGGNDYFGATASSDFAMGTGDFTLEVWVYPENLSVHQMILDTITPGVSGSQAGRFVAYLNPNKLAYYRPGTGTTTSSGSQTVKQFSWNHLAWVRNSGTLKMYLNGEETHSVAETYNFSLTNLSLGRDAASGGTGQARSYWSDLRLVKGTAVYTSEFTPPTAPLGTISGTVLHLPFTDFRIFDKSQSYLPPHSVSIDRLGISGSVVASSTQQHFSENTVYFDGSSDYIDMPWHISGYEDHTHEAWVYPTGGDSTYGGFWSSITTNGATGINVSRDLAGGPSNSSPAMATFSGGVPANQWSHVMLQRQSGVHSLYKDGVLQGTSTINANFTSTVIRLGSRYNNNTTWSFGGYMHDFRISKGLSRYPYTSSKVTLTQTNSGMTKPDGTTPTATASNTKLLACHDSTKTTEGSATGHTITSSGSTASGTIVPKYGMNSVYFPNGDSDYFQIGASTEHQIYGGDYTVEAWLYPTALNASYNYFMSKGGNSTREWGFSISASNIVVYWSQNGSNDQTIIKTVTNNLNEWMHVAFVKNGTDIAIFKNGSFIGNGTFNSIYSGNGVTTIGRLFQYTGISHSFDGYISNLRIVKGQALYAKNFTPTTEALIS